jgi:Cdc6-like AAA superfamily ATPase
MRTSQDTTGSVSQNGTVGTTNVTNDCGDENEHENRCKVYPCFQTLAPTQKEAFSRLWATLSTSLRKETNPVVCLAGPRGYGKRHILDHCMNGVYHERFTAKTKMAVSKRNHPNEEDAAAAAKKVVQMCLKRPRRTVRTKLRIVRISGVLLKGDDGAAAKEIVRQLSTQAAEEAQDATSTSTTSQQAGVKRPFSSAGSGSGVVSHSSSFHSNVALLDEALKRARIDKVPIWIIVHDVDAFAATAGNGNGANKSNTSCNSNRAYSTNAVSAARLQNNKQVLLYHLLDMAASESTYMGVLWTTSRFNLLEMLEKRIRSRAVGTQVVLQLTKHQPQAAAASALSSSTTGAGSRCRKRNENGLEDWAPCLHAMMRGSGSETLTFQKNDDDTQQQQQENCCCEDEDDYFVLLKQMLANPRDPVTVLLQRQISLGQSLRWFQRLMTFAKSRLVGVQARQRHPTRLRSKNVNHGTNTNIPQHPEHPKEKLYFLKRALTEACDIMGCDMSHHVSHHEDDNGEHDNDNNKDMKQLQFDGKLEGEEVTSTGTTRHQAQTYNHNPRLQSLLDLSICQLLLVFSARRIIVRDSVEAQNQDEEVLLRKSTGHQRGLQRGTTLASLGASISTVDYHRPLTFERMYEEYHTYFVKPHSGGGGDDSDNNNNHRRGGQGHQVMFSMLVFSKEVVQCSFLQLLECDLFRPAMDHVGSTSGAYHYKRRFVGPFGGGIIHTAGPSKGNTVCALELTTAPLHIMVHLELELYPLVQSGDLTQCTTVVKEWGMARF